jgi:hypothetical protein
MKFDWKEFFKLNRIKIIVLAVLIIVFILWALSSSCLTFGAPCHNPLAGTTPFFCNLCPPYEVSNILFIVGMPLALISFPLTIASMGNLLAAIPFLIVYWYFLICLIYSLIESQKRKSNKK